jgi:LAS superfamily LD-carboxypeptidase LdcB
VGYDEKRVTTKVFGSLSGTSPLLVEIPTAPNRPAQRLHKLAAAGLHAMAGAVATDLGIVLLGASGWRAHRWKDWPTYVNFVTTKYGSLAKGRKFLAFDSPHETGLVIDFGCGGLEPRSATISRQQQTPLHHWLVANASRFRWHPYKAEPWHWEFPVSLAAYKTGIADNNTAPTCAPDDPLCVEAPLDEDS